MLTVVVAAANSNNDGDDDDDSDEEGNEPDPEPIIHLAYVDIRAAGFRVHALGAVETKWQERDSLNHTIYYH